MIDFEDLNLIISFDLGYLISIYEPRNREADQRLSFHYIDTTITLLSKSEISSL